jgi:integrase
MSRKKLTVEFVRRVRPPKAGRDEYFDSLLPAFCLRVTETGARSYVCFYRIGGKLRRYTIGRAEKIGLDVARQLAREAFEAAARGEDMAAAKKAARLAPAVPAMPRLFEAQAREFIKRHVANQRSARETTLAIERDLISAWSGRLVTDIGKADVLELLDEIQDAGHHRARNRRLQVIRRMFNWFIERGVVQVNPAAGIKPLPEKNRQRVLTDNELRAIWTAAGEIAEPAGTFVKLLMMTAQRRTEVATIEWPEIDKAAKLWTVPEAKYKTGFVHLVPLSAPVLDLLNARPKFKDGDKIAPFALSYSNGKRPMVGNFGTVKAELDTLSGVKGWVFHDLRRSVRTRLSQIGINADVAERVLGHLPGGVRGIYDRHDFLDEKRNALTLWARTLQAIVENKAGENIVALRAAR